MRISSSIFRKYDIRGTYPEELNPGVVNTIVARLGRRWTSVRGKSKLIILGHDARESSDLFYRVAWHTMRTYPDLKILPVGLITTPMLYYMVGSRHATGGLLITASHSPINYNGMKIVEESAVNISGTQVGVWLKNYKLPEKHKVIFSDEPVPVPDEDYYSDYAAFLSGIPGRLSGPFKLVADCSNSPAGLILKKIRVPNLEIVLLNTRPDGGFPAHGPNPLRPGALDELKREIKKHRADFGVAFDGDADRAVFVDDLSRPVHPDLAAYMLMRGFRPPFVMDARTGWLVRNSPCKIFLSPVGHTNVKRIIRAHDAGFGAETSGHFFFRNRFGRSVSYNDSALQAVMHMLRVLSSASGKFGNLSGLLDSLPKSARGEVNFEVKNWSSVESRLVRAYPEKLFRITRLDGLSVEDKKSPPDFWFNIRPSNTEPILRLSMEAVESSVLETEIRKLENIIRPIKSERQGAV